MQGSHRTPIEQVCPWQKEEAEIARKQKWRIVSFTILNLVVLGILSAALFIHTSVDDTTTERNHFLSAIAAIANVLPAEKPCNWLLIAAQGLIIVMDLSVMIVNVKFAKKAPKAFLLNIILRTMVLIGEIIIVLQFYVKTPDNKTLWFLIFYNILLLPCMSIVFHFPRKKNNVQPQSPSRLRF